MAANGQNPRQGILSLAIKDKSSLYAAYMPFVKNGGLFIPTTRPYKLGDEVFMLLTLTDSKEKLPVAGKVVWLTPGGAQGGRSAGIGVQFSELDNGATRSKIETQLAGALKSERHTHTM
ncbi:MAG: PilZ domain-containing protein [Gammaproteobacteria bacterium]|jgi:type IV pilus assembly protein PilZ|nr:PilZ domain-containing protein [Gammaproteobacteria bacterium]